MPARPNVIAVRTDVAVELLIRGLVEDAATRALPRVDAAALAGVAPAADPAVGARVADHGYALRRVEVERFERAREPVPWLEQRLREQPGERPAHDLAVALARDEPAELPGPDDPRAATWRVPGPGGHVRHHAARMWVAELAPDARGDAVEGLLRCWLYGFFLSCGEQLGG